MIITYYWPPSGGAGVQRCLKMAKYFHLYGIQPYVLTVRADKASYPLIDNSLEKEVSPDIKVHRTSSFEPLNIYKKMSGAKNLPYGGMSNFKQENLSTKLLKFIRGNFFIPDPRRGWNRYAVKKARQLIKEHNIDAVITSSPPHSTQLIGLKLKEEFNIPWIADIRDPWTDIYFYEELMHTKLAAYIDRQYEQKVLEKADSVLVVSKAIKQLFEQKISKADDKILVVPNGFDETDFITESRPPAGEFCITYTGSMADSYEPEVFFKAVKAVSANYPEVKFKVRLIGNIPPGTRHRIMAVGLEKDIEFIGYVTHAESINFLLSSTVLLLIIPNVEKAEGILTGKLFEYLAARKPIICLGPVNGDAAEIITECKAGRTFNRDSEAPVREYLNQLVRQWKTNPDLDLKSNEYKKYSRQEQVSVVAGRIEEISPVRK